MMEGMNQPGIGSVNMEQTIYTNIQFSKEVINKTAIRLTNQIWKLIPMRENDEDWQKQLDTIIIEVAGLNQIFFDNMTFLQLLSKLEGLKQIDTSFELYRKTVFESISLLQELKKQ